MLKWAMRIVAVGGALLAMAVGTAAWSEHPGEGRRWFIATAMPAVCSKVVFTQKFVSVEEWPTRDWDVRVSWTHGRNGIALDSSKNFVPEIAFDNARSSADSGVKWRGVGILRGNRLSAGYTTALFPTSALVAVLLLPTGLWAILGWRQRRKAAAGHCISCGYDLRATPDKCPECGRVV